MVCPPQLTGYRRLLLILKAKGVHFGHKDLNVLHNLAELSSHPVTEYEAVVGGKELYHTEAKLLVVSLLFGLATKRLVLELVEDFIGLVSHLLDGLEPGSRPFSMGSHLLGVGDDVQDCRQLCIRISCCSSVPFITLY